MDGESFLKLSKQQGYDRDSHSLFQKALDVSKRYFSRQERLSGDTFFDHNLRVAVILVENKAAPEVVVAGLLHGGVPQLESFSKEIVKLVNGANALKDIKSRNKQTRGETLRKILLTTLDDVRVILVKLAAKLDNLRSIKVLPPREQKRIAQEVLDVYAPLANRLGVDKMRVPLEDNALRILHPKIYGEISNFLEESREERDASIAKAIEQIQDICKNKVEISRIKGRSKHIYSIYKKIVGRKVKLHQQYDLLGIRVIVSSIRDCYTLLGLLHEKFSPVEGRLKDYIANPKSNYYRSIHTGITLPNGKLLEVQIRTPEMDEFAEEGVAAHWRYKGVKSDQLFEKKISWLRGVLDLQRDSKEFLETAKVDVFGDKIYCYTPRGDVKELPAEATILDFAFMVHEEVGSRAVGGRVNGSFVPLRHKLCLGDVVEIVTSKNQRPRRSWLKLVRSARARQKIRKSLKEHEKLAPLHFRLPKPILREEQGVLVESEDFPRALCVLAKCCQAVPGDDITGIVTKRKVVSVHREDCKQAVKQRERWVSASWKETFNQKIRFFVQAHERSGLLADLLHTIASAGFEVKEAKAKLLGNEEECSFQVIPRDLDDLKRLIKRVKKVKGVRRIYFE